MFTAHKCLLVFREFQVGKSVSHPKLRSLWAKFIIDQRRAKTTLHLIISRLELFGRVEKTTERCSNLRTWRSPRDRRNKTEGEKCYTKKPEGDRSTASGRTRPENAENENTIRRTQMRKRMKGKCCHLPATPSSGSRVISGAA